MKKHIIILILFIVLICCASSISAASNEPANNITSKADKELIPTNNDAESLQTLQSRKTLSVDENYAGADTLTTNSTNKNKSFTELNNLINGDLNKTEIILTENYTYQEDCDGNFTQGIHINRSITIDGQGHTIHFDKPYYIFHINADNVTLKNIILYNSKSIGIISCNASNLNTTNITIAPMRYLNLNILVNDTYDVYNHTDIINIEFETNIANADFWVEIPGLVEKTNLRTNNECKATLSISNITKSGTYGIKYHFIIDDYYKNHDFPFQLSPIVIGTHFFEYAEIFQIMYRNKTKNNDSFTNLQLLIDNSISNEINLERDYEYYSGDKPININKSIVINGNNHIIDGKNVSKIFNIKADNVIIRNITLMGASDNRFYNKYSYFIFYPLSGQRFSYNAVKYNPRGFYDITYYSSYYSHNSGAIYCSGNNLKIINTTFINNYASTGGGLYIAGDNAQLINLIFINNSAQSGGAIYNAGKNTFISNSQFDSNEGRFADSICSENNINIQNCNFINDSKSVIFIGGEWQIDNMASSYYNSFLEFGHVDFTFNLTHIKNDQYNLEITFKIKSFWFQTLENKKFYVNIDDKIYVLQTDAKAVANLNLRLDNGLHNIRIYNPITKLSITKSFVISDSTPNVYQNTSQIVFPGVIKRIFLKITARNMIFKKKVKVKKYSVLLSDNDDKAVKNTRIVLKINGKIFKAKTNKNGKATFKINKLNKKGKYIATIIFKGNMKYSEVTKTVKINIK